MIINASSHQIPLADGSVHAIVTSPPYFGLRKYEGAQDVAWPAGTYAPMTGCPPCIEVPAMACPFGNEPTIEAYIWHSLLILRECRRVLREDGVLWWNVGDSYSKDGKWGGASSSKNYTSEGGNYARDREVHGVEQGNLLGIPHRVMLAAQADGWLIRNDCVWAKVSPMPESVKGWRMGAEGRFTAGSWRHTRAHEYVFQMVKGMGYYCDGEVVREGLAASTQSRHAQSTPMTISGQFKGSPIDKRFKEEGKRVDGSSLPPSRNPRSVLSPPPSAYSGSHFAVFPPELIRPLILASVPRRCCPACGTAWAPVVKTPDFSAQPKRGTAKMERSDRTSSGQAWQDWRNNNPDTIEAYRAVCDCGESSHVPGIVLDPFCGSGTTGEVARECLVRFIGLDISFLYLRDQASWRAERKVSAAKVEAMPLFATGA